MTKVVSQVIITFQTLKEIEVSINSIDTISPRGIELAMHKVNKRFAEMKGERIHERKQAEKAASKSNFAKEQEEIVLANLAKEEHAKFDADAQELALKAYNNKNREEKKVLLAANELEKESTETKKFLEQVQTEIENQRSMSTLSDDPEEVVDGIITTKEQVEEGLNDLKEEVTEAKAELNLLENAEEGVEEGSEESKTDSDA